MGVLECDLVAVARKGLPHGGELQRHLRVTGEAEIGQPAEQRDIGLADTGRVPDVHGVLPEMVERHGQALLDEASRGCEGVAGLLAHDEALDEAAGHGRTRDEALDPRAA